MKQFLIRIVLLLVVLAVTFILSLTRLNNANDPFYIRFTTPQQQHLILGTSRAAQALQPRIFDSIIGTKMYNYAFTMHHSPYGQTYLESIKKKLNPNTKNGVFILTLDPWSISGRPHDPDNDSLFEESKLCLGFTSSVTSNPNLEYSYNAYKGKYLKLFKPKSKTMYLHNNGWLELTIPMDSLSIAERTKKREIAYRTIQLPDHKYSNLRFNYLLETISFLKNHGKVYIVKLPVNKAIQEIEYELMPNFETKINKAILASDGYLNLTKKSDKFKYIDGNHLYKTSGKEVSVLISNWIKTKN